MPDKRIYELSSILLDEDLFFPVDKGGRTEAGKVSITDILSFLSLNASVLKAELFGGLTNPDDAIGLNGDIYFKNTASVIGIYQKKNDAWDQVIEISKGGTTDLDLNETHLIPTFPGDYNSDPANYSGGFYVELPPVGTVVSVTYRYTGEDKTYHLSGPSIEQDINWAPNDIRVFGFTTNAPITITIKTI